jgi:hypothetical protein
LWERPTFSPLKVWLAGPDYYAQLQEFNQNVVRDDVQQAKPEDIDPACEEHAVKALIYGLTRKVTRFARLKVRYAF